MSEETITRASQIVADVQQKLLKAKTREERISAECKALGYEVHVQGKSRKQLDALIAEQVGLKAEVASLIGALEVANQKLESGQGATKKAADEDRARQLRAVVQRMTTRARRIDEALARTVDEANALQADLTEARQLGAEFSQQVLLLNVGAAFKTARMRLNGAWGRDSEHLAPSLRRTFVGFTDQMARTVERDICRRLGEEQETPSRPATEDAAKPSAPPAETSGTDKADKAMPPRSWIKERVA